MDRRNFLRAIGLGGVATAAGALVAPQIAAAVPAVSATIHGHAVGMVQGVSVAQPAELAPIEGTMMAHQLPSITATTAMPLDISPYLPDQSFVLFGWDFGRGDETVRVTMTYDSESGTFVVRDFTRGFVPFIGPIAPSDPPTDTELKGAIDRFVAAYPKPSADFSDE